MRCVATQKIGPPSSVNAPQTAKKYSRTKGTLIGPVSVQPVIAHADAKSGRYPVEKHRHCQTLPIEHKQSGNRSNMEQEEDGAGDPVQSTRRKLYEFCTHSFTWLLRCWKNTATK